MSKRYACWGTDVVYKFKWRAALQDAIIAFRQRYKKVVPVDPDLDSCDMTQETDERPPV